MKDICEENLLEPETENAEGTEAVVESAALPAPRKKVPLTARLWAKVTAFILAVLVVCTCGFGVLAAVVMVNEDVYTRPQAEYLDIVLGNLARSDGSNVAQMILLEQAADSAQEYLVYRNVAKVELRIDGENNPHWTYEKNDTDISYAHVYRREFDWWLDGQGNDYITFWKDEGGILWKSGTVTVWLAEEFTEQDDYWLAQTVIDAMYYFRYSVYVIMGVSAILAIACFIFLLCASGKHPDHEGVRPGWGTRIPIAAGDLNYQVDTKRMLPVFKRHAENLNCIGEGMTRAVEERTKSERMKTELITNVSHDIKTPLTSIINYADLIGKEPCDNEKITEYAEVLHRQSERLKRLIDDLVEASKASTGNLDISLTPCEVGVLLTQTAGEYEYRLREQGLELVTRQPDKPLRIMADGRRLWRVFDNLMNNVCKYGQSGTRVYLTLEKLNGQAVISFKNTSREELNLSPDELMERFVRGDAARKSEGSGLGLSIARSLTELQRGSMELTVDGDLFKVVLRFPIIP